MIALKQIHGMYHMDPAHSSLGFSVRHAGIAKVRGTFDSFHGWAMIDSAATDQSALLVSVLANSINTRDHNRDAHLHQSDFLEVERYPSITFVGTGFEILDDFRVVVRGDLTIRKLTKPISVAFDYEGGSTDPFGNRRIGFTGSAAISRSDFGLVWNAALETGGVLISDEVKLEFEVSAVQRAESLE